MKKTSYSLLLLLLLTLGPRATAQVVGGRIVAPTFDMPIDLFDTVYTVKRFDGFSIQCPFADKAGRAHVVAPGWMILDSYTFDDRLVASDSVSILVDVRPAEEEMELIRATSERVMFDSVWLSGDSLWMSGRITYIMEEPLLKVWPCADFSLIEEAGMMRASVCMLPPERLTEQVRRDIAWYYPAEIFVLRTKLKVKYLQP